MPAGGSQRQLTVSPAPESARQARRFVSEVLVDGRVPDDLVDVATLLTSELVTNGIVHAHTDLRVVVEVTGIGLRVEVCDGNPMLPARRDYDEAAMTGRGIELVELLAHEFGAEQIDGGGKRVWFRLVFADGAAADDPDDVEQVDAGEPSPHETRSVVLAGLPVALYCAWQQHADALLRESTLVALDEAGSAPGDYPMAAQALGALAGAAHEVFALRDNEVATADVSLDISAEAVPYFPILRDLLARGTVLARSGRLLTPPSLPEIVGLRNWLCEEVARQSAGLPPQPWTSIDGEDVEATAASAGSLAAVRESSLALVAADASNRIVAVSPAAAELLGWDARELEGRRLVSVIPPRFRDRHIAGFTRHLLDGSGRILDRSVDVRALRRDGTEVAVTMRIERRPDPATRALFVATFTTPPQLRAGGDRARPARN